MPTALLEPPDWVRDAVFYQIFPDRFAASPRVPKPGPLEPWDAAPTIYGFKGGDLLGIVERLPYLVDLGISALYLTPVFASASNHRYHTYDYFTVDPLLGGDDALRELLDAAHARDIRVVLDGVFNHTGRGFWPFHHLLEAGANSPYRGWFHVDAERLSAGRPLHAYPEGRAPEATGDGSWSRRMLGYQAWWDMAALPKLNTDEPAVREYIYRVAEHWLRFGIDGWRLDVPEEIPDAAFWREFRERVRAVNRDAYLVGEIWRIAPEWIGDRFDALMNYPLAEAILSFTGGGHLDEPLLRRHHEYGPRVLPLDGAAFAARLEEMIAAYGPAAFAVQLNLLDSHDTPRFHSLVSEDRASYRLAVALQATLPGAPCVYYGDEVGVAGGIDPDSRRAFPEDGAWDHELHRHVRSLLQLRSGEPALRRGELAILAAEQQAVAFERMVEGSSLVCVVNAGPAAVRMAVAGSGRVVWADQAGTVPPSWSDGAIAVDARAAAFFRRA
jgi:cyclomaltodextrinase